MLVGLAFGKAQTRRGHELVNKLKQHGRKQNDDRHFRLVKLREDEDMLPSWKGMEETKKEFQEQIEDWLEAIEKEINDKL